MKKFINPQTNKEDYKLNLKETAEYLGMTLSQLWYRLKDKRCKLNKDFVPPVDVEYGKYVFYLSKLEHFKKIKRFAIPKSKVDEEKPNADVKEISKNKKVLNFSKT